MPNPENLDPAAQAARIKELEAALARQTPPANGIAAVHMTLNAALGMFPRWLIVAAGVVIVTIVAWGAYNLALTTYYDRTLKEQQFEVANSPLTLGPLNREEQKFRVEALKKAYGGSCDENKTPVPLGWMFLDSGPKNQRPCIALDGMTIREAP